jgi:putative phage-type endonuclease
MADIHQQGSPEWLEYRRNKIGASDAAAIMGISPYRTAYELWEEKTGRREPPPTNPAMRRGNELEPMIREYYQELTGHTFLPHVATHPEIDFLIASLDGISFCGTKILEIKTCNADVFQQAKDQVVVPHYYAQIQHQFACCPQATEAHYVCYHRGEYAWVVVKRDEEYIANLLSEELEFYHCVVHDISPHKGENDYLQIEDEEFTMAATAYIQAKKALDAAKLQESICKSALLDLTDDGNCESDIIRLTKCLRTSTDYKAAALSQCSKEELVNFAKTPVPYWKITIKESKCP